MAKELHENSENSVADINSSESAKTMETEAESANNSLFQTAVSAGIVGILIVAACALSALAVMPFSVATLFCLVIGTSRPLTSVVHHALFDKFSSSEPALAPALN